MARYTPWRTYTLILSCEVMQVKTSSTCDLTERFQIRPEQLECALLANRLSSANSATLPDVCCVLPGMMLGGGSPERNQKAPALESL